MTRQELVDYYGAKGEQIPLTYRGETNSGYDNNEQPDYAEIYEIWDKRSLKQIFIATDFDDILEEFEDPYNLEGFWPMPEPLYAISTTDTTLPVPEIFTYEDQLQELDLITQRLLWEPESDTAESWAPESDTSAVWTNSSDNSSNWTIINDTPDTWTPVTDGSTSWTPI